MSRIFFSSRKFCDFESRDFSFPRAEINRIKVLNDGLLGKTPPTAYHNKAIESVLINSVRYDSDCSSHSLDNRHLSS